jgi:hypothetical protein
MAMVAWAVLVYAFMWFYFAGVNAKRAKGEEDHLVEGMSDEEIAELGDDSPRFVYTI